MNATAVTRRRRWRWRVCLALAGGLGAAGVGLLTLRCWALAAGIRDHQYTYEYYLPLWVPEADVGFVNRPGYSAWCWGNVRIETNDLGFRGGAPVAPRPAPGTTRIVCLGDSVMWGAGVAETRALPGRLADALRPAGQYEVINAGVVSHATLQEALWLERAILPLEPDVVAVNFCENDLLPTGDPFRNVRQVYANYLHHAAGEADAGGRLKSLSDCFQAPPAGTLAAIPSELETTAFEQLVCRPWRDMARACQRRGVRLICLFIPPRRATAEYDRMVETLIPALADAGVEWLDLRVALVPEADALPGIGERGNTVSWTDAGWLRDLNNLKRVRNLEQLHRRNKYLDHWHLTERGAAIAAGELARLLLAPPNSTPP